MNKKIAVIKYGGSSVSNFNKIKQQLLPYILNSNNFNVYYNILSKDFGVTKDKILVDRIIV